MKIPKKNSNRLSKKFIGGITCILLMTFVLSVFINSRVVERYYLYQQRAYVRQIGIRLKNEIESGMDPDHAIERMEEEENVLIVYSDVAKEADDLSQVSQELRETFRQKGLGFQKFWLWDQDYVSATQNGMRFRLYQQEKLNYGILVEYLPIGSQLYAIAAIVPNAAGFIRIINRFGGMLNLVSLAVAVILIYFLIKRITKPLGEIEAFTQKISSRHYETLKIKTGDELEMVAESLNQMGADIQQYQKMLEDKNRQMEELLDNVAHDLKTPLSLVGMYVSGIKDGLDDGTFLSTILRQNTRMIQLTEQLLDLSRIGRKEYGMAEVLLDEVLKQCLEEQKIRIKDRGLILISSIDSPVAVMGSEELIYTVFSNLLSNAVKYASGDEIKLALKKADERAMFRISNEIQNESLDLERIWDAFYVGEPSRDKTLSGTGLGLAIVKKIAQQCGYAISCEKRSDRISFTVII